MGVYPAWWREGDLRYCPISGTAACSCRACVSMSIRYIVTGFFDSTPLEKQLANLECNATAAVQITHHFLQTLIKSKQRGCFVYTSSVSGYMPSPFSCKKIRSPRVRSMSEVSSQSDEPS